MERDLLLEKQISRWRCCYGEEFPSEDMNQAVVFKSFYEKCLGIKLKKERPNKSQTVQMELK